MLRMNLLVVTLTFVMDVEYQFYYFVPLISFWFTIQTIALSLPLPNDITSKVCYVFVLHIWILSTFKNTNDTSSLVPFLLNTCFLSRLTKSASVVYLYVYFYFTFYTRPNNYYWGCFKGLFTKRNFAQMYSVWRFSVKLRIEDDQA